MPMLEKYPERRKQMQTMIKATLTAAFIAALTWPLLFWGKSESSEHTSRMVQKPPASFILVPQSDPVW